MATITYNSNGSSTSIASEAVDVGTSYTISSTIPTLSMHNFLGWAYNGSTYQPGDSLTVNGDITFTASWSQPVVTNTGTYVANILRGGMYYYVKFRPVETGYYGITSIASTGSSSDTYGYVYSSSGSQLESDDDDGSGNHFMICREFTADTDYYIGVRYYSNSYTGDITVEILPSYPISKKYGENYQYTSTSYKTKGVATTFGLITKSDTTLETWNVYFKGNGAGDKTKTTEYQQSWDFDSWNTQPDGSGTRYTSSTEYTIDAPITVYAQYVPTVKEANTITVPSISWDNRIFLGWSHDKYGFDDAQAITSYTPTQNNETLYAIWYAPKCYVKTEDGWKFGRSFFKTADGWQYIEKLNVKKEDGWKEGKMYGTTYVPAIQGPLTGASNITWNPFSTSNRPRIDINFTFMYERSGNTAATLIQFPYQTPQYQILMTIDTTTGNIKYTGSNRTSYINVGLTPGEWHTFRLYANDGYYVYPTIDGVAHPYIYMPSYWSAANPVTVGSSEIWFKSISISCGRSGYSNVSVTASEDLVGNTINVAKGSSALISSVPCAGKAIQELL